MGQYFLSFLSLLLSFHFSFSSQHFSHCFSPSFCIPFLFLFLTRVLHHSSLGSVLFSLLPLPSSLSSYHLNNNQGHVSFPLLLPLHSPLFISLVRLFFLFLCLSFLFLLLILFTLTLQTITHIYLLFFVFFHSFLFFISFVTQLSKFLSLFSSPFLSFSFLFFQLIRHSIICVSLLFLRL